jgi:hypothetical protein
VSQMSPLSHDIPLVICHMTGTSVDLAQVVKNYAKKYFQSELQKMSALSSPLITLAVLGL